MQIRSRVRSELTGLMSRAPRRWLGSVERMAQEAQGKGWGAASIQREITAFFDLLGQTGLRSPEIYDVGANVGAWTLGALQRDPTCTITAFEPSETAFQALSRGVSGSPRVRLAQVALSDSEGEADLWSDAPGSGLGSLTRRDLSLLGIDFTTSQRVRTTTLDAWISQNSRPPQALKLDVEGAEWSVLAGASKALEEVRLVQFEFGGAQIDQRLYFADFFRFFAQRGFEVLRITPTGIEPIRRYSECDETFRTTNYLAVKR